MIYYMVLFFADPQPVTQTSATPSLLEVSATGVEKHIAPTRTSFPFKRSNSDSLGKDMDRPTSSNTHKLKKAVSTSSHNTSILNYGVKTTKEDKEKIDEKVATMVYATNSPFKIVEHASFRDMVNVMRPGYKLPSRREIGGSLLDKVYDKECEKSVVDLEGKTVCMSLDGWTNVSNEPVICASVTVHTSENTSSVYLVDTIDTSGHPHTSDYLKGIATRSIETAEHKYKCKVGSFVTDNAANVAKMRSELLKDDEYNLISYGCSAHILNLLAKDLEIGNIKEHIVKIVKYFRNNHTTSAAYKAAGGSTLIVPQDVRWNTLSDCLEGYLNNWPILVSVCDGEKRNQLDPVIIRKVMDTYIKRSAEDMLKILKLIAIALDKVQRDRCDIGEATEVWKDLQNKLAEESVRSGDSAVIEDHFMKRMKLALTPVHYLANILHPAYKGKKLTMEEENMGMNWINENCPSALSLIMIYKAELPPFQPYMFSAHSLNAGPLAWWLSLGKIVEDKNYFSDLVRKLFTTTASSSGVERIFSSFGLVHSKLRNRLGIEKAAKLVFIYKNHN